MSDYTGQILKAVVAKICQTIGWHSIQTTPLEIMVDISRRYFMEITKLTQAYAVQFGHTQPNFDELALAFRDMHINISDLEEYIHYVEATPPLEVPKYPLPKESHLNFLKPGSNEVVTRPVHIHEHLPPMLPEIEDVKPTAMKKEESPTSPKVEYLLNGASVFKKPADITDTPSKRPRLLIEEEGRPTREISSVMMTTSGFLSPAREGKLPEARTPHNPLETLTIPTSSADISQPPPNPPSAIIPRAERKVPTKSVKEKKKDRVGKELFKNESNLLHPTKKGIAKEPRNKNKANLLAAQMLNAIDKPNVVPAAKNTTKSPGMGKKAKTPKAEKFNPIPPMNVTNKAVINEEKVVEGKLSSEPDKVKLNIFKKISKVKEDKMDKQEKAKLKEETRLLQEKNIPSRGSSPDLIIDETDNKPVDTSKMQQYSVMDEYKDMKPIKCNTAPDIGNKIYDAVMSDDYLSPPGTPLTPKTPEMLFQSPPAKVEKRKRKEKTKIKKQGKSNKNLKQQPPINEINDMEIDRPKTPDNPVLLIKDSFSNLPVNMFPYFPSLPAGPGLIPPPNPFIPGISKLVKPGFGQPPHMSAMPLPFVPIKPPLEDLPQPATPATPSESNSNNGDVIYSVIKEKHKKDKKDKIKKKNKKDKIKNKGEKRKTKEEKREKEKLKKEKKGKKKEKEKMLQKELAPKQEQEGSVPKLTLKISSPRPPTPDTQVSRKIMIKQVVKKEEHPPAVIAIAEDSSSNRQPSPELAKISALITRPPKLKSKEHVNKEESGSQGNGSSPKQNGSSVGRSRVYNLNKNPLLVSSLKESKVEASPTQKPSVQYSAPDTEENKVWICPACGRQDDGSPMIGCDDCDAWYHWVCVGIQVPPDDNEDWYCRICIVKKQVMIQDDKKKKRRKKKEKNQD